MTNNDMLSRLRYAVNINDDTMLEMIELGGTAVTPQELESYFRKEEEEGYHPCGKTVMIALLDGMIIKYRGKKEDSGPVQRSTEFNNNIVLKKVRIALQLQEEDLLEIMKLSGFELSKSEISALFRKKGHRNFKECKDQIMRNFLKGLALFRNQG